MKNSYRIVVTLSCVTALTSMSGCSGEPAESARATDSVINGAEFTPVLGGTWGMLSGKYALTNPATATPHGNLSIANAAPPTDFTLSVDAAVSASASAWDDFSIVFNYADVNNYYFVSFNESNDERTSGVFNYLNGVLTQLVDISAAIQAGTTYSIRIVRQGSGASILRNGVQIASAAGLTRTGGKVGLGSRNDPAQFDNFAVSTLGSADAGSPPPPPPPANGFPTAATTGYPKGLPGDVRRPVTLAPYSGPMLIRVAGTVIDGKDINGQLQIRAHDVVIRNSRIRVANASAIDTRDPNNNLLVEDTEIDGQNADRSAGGIALVGYTGYTLRRVNAYGSGDILRMEGWAEVHDSWLHDPYRGATTHNDVIQSTNAHHLRIVHNRLDNQHTQTSCILLKADLGPISDVVVDRNLMNGGGYTFYWYDHNTGNYRITNGSITNNRFMRAPTGGFWPKGGYYGTHVFRAAQLPVWSGNVWHDTGAVLPR
ncbi:MAG TPA: hypothetical protein VK524_31915 [Polyangiaceae bacterium]|nr:hypothetical protein [Polyangiaceae bacterium]